MIVPTLRPSGTEHGRQCHRIEGGLWDWDSGFGGWLFRDL